MPIQLRKRCANGSRKNKHGDCAPNPNYVKRKNCSHGSRKNKVGDCVANLNDVTKKRCRNDTRKNKVGDCVPYTKKVNPRKSSHSSSVEVLNPRNESNASDLLLALADEVEEIIDDEVDAVTLKQACMESGLCIAFGIEEAKIRKFFNNFHFKLATAVRRIGQPSANGFVQEIKYTKRDYEAFAVLKSAKNNLADNMMYEFRVGLFLNKMSPMYPCFLQTYGLYRYVSVDAWEAADKKNMDATTISTMLRPIQVNWKRACNDNTRLCYLMQHIGGCTEVSKIMKADNHHLMFPILYQVYYALFHMRENFTHYDLHWNNVVLYTPKAGEYIQYHYETEGGVVSFKSLYLVKIIDYGRAYFNDGDENSKSIYDEICKRKNCETVCGDERGFRYFKENSVHWVVTQKKNESHDLRFLSILLDEFKSWKHKAPKWFSNLVIPYNELEYIGDRGTPEKTCPNKPCDLTAVYKLLNVTLPLSNIKCDEQYSSLTKFGDLYIGFGKPVRFVKA